MAIVKFGGGVTDMRGSVAGNVFSRNGGGSYVRQKVSPINPNTTRQQLVRGRLDTLSKQWANLAPGLRVAWKNFGIQHPKTNAFGEPIVLNGLQSYQRVNGVILNLGEERTDTPPPNFDVPEFVIQSAVLKVSNNTLTIDELNGDPGDNIKMEARITAAISPGITFVKNLLRFVDPSDANPGPSVDLVLPARFGTIVVGETRAISARYSNFVNGAQSIEQILFIQVIAGP